MKVLMVCTGNICRSPMAEALLRHALGQRGVDDIEVSSVGTWAGFGGHATEEAQQVLKERGIDLAPHRSRPLEREHLEEADLVIAMTSVHLREIGEVDQSALAKTRLLKEIVELEMDEVADRSSRAERLEAVLAAARPEPRRALDLDDPIGLPYFSYVKCAGDIATGIDRLAELLCGVERENA